MSDMRRLMALVEKVLQGGHGIEGLPPDVEIKDRHLLRMLDSGRYRAVAKPGWRDGRYTIELHPRDTDGMEPYRNNPEKDVNHWRDPAVTEIEITNPGEEYLERHYARAKNGYSHEIEPLPGRDIIYRGMSFEEYQSYRQTGEIKSNGSFNIGAEQVGLTYWATDPDTAVSYANSFALAHLKPTFGKPCYVMATQRPKEVRMAAGTGSNEVGVARAIHADEILAVWEGRVYAFSPGNFDIAQDYMRGDGYHSAGSSDPSTSVVWHRIA